MYTLHRSLWALTSTRLKRHWLRLRHILNQTVKALAEAEAYPGPSLIIAYAPCINHGIKKGMSKAQTEEKLAVESGYWFNFRYNPTLAAEGKDAFSLDSKAPSKDYQEFLKGENRYASLAKFNLQELRNFSQFPSRTPKTGTSICRSWLPSTRQTKQEFYQKNSALGRLSDGSCRAPDFPERGGFFRLQETAFLFTKNGPNDRIKTYLCERNR